ncbi:MAG TPA: heavy-metal-associated domain-containing protein [Saprospiraceae bacterium]|nr:heavy-metal-associated domain-containing protein [Saprospiraceae bacterium]
MNTPIKYIQALALFLFFVTGISTNLSAQAKSTATADQTISFHVSGVCGECKERIESTVMDVKGVKKAEWDPQSDMLVVVGTAKMDKQKIANALAKAGHKSDLAEADPKAYEKLPKCCQYDSGAKKH